LPVKLPDLRLESFLKIGVWRGGTGSLLARRLALAGSAEPVYLCDTFAGVVKAGEQDGFYKGGEHTDTSKELVERLLQPLHIKNAHLIQVIRFNRQRTSWSGRRAVWFRGA
jgi:O-methyltransferase